VKSLGFALVKHLTRSTLHQCRPLQLSTVFRKPTVINDNLKFTHKLRLQFGTKS